MFVNRRSAVTLFTLPVLAILGLAGLTARTGAAADLAEPSHNLNDYVVGKLDDFSASMKVVEFNEHEGVKINKDFPLIYKIKGDIKVKYKEENKLRIDGMLGASNATLIVNGTTQYATIPAAHIKTRISLGKEPGKRKTLLDVGMISSGYLAYTQGEFKRTQVVDGILCAVFSVSYRDKSLDTSHRMIWIDPRTKITLKRDEYAQGSNSQVGKLNATFLYKQPKEVKPGIWFPTRIEAYNNEGKRAGITAYSDVNVNVGLAESVFVQ
jgi:outer membrane lipoprotein-sorting protein